jgi:heme exporter protein A
VDGVQDSRRIVKLVLDRLAAERGGKTLFSGISRVIERGTLVRVQGANGAGKTTLLRILAGLGAASDGSMRWVDDEAGGACDVAPACAMVFVGHANACNDALSVRENLTYAAALSGFNDDQALTSAIDHALAAFGVRSLVNRRFGTLSQGQRKRCSLARLLLAPAGTRRAWLLDEPFVALDAATQALLAQLIAAEISAGGLVVYTSHQSVDIAAARSAEITL